MTYYKPNKFNDKMPPLGGTPALSEASVEELRVLLCVIEKGCIPANGVATLARAAGCSVPRTRAALRYWCECFVLIEDENASSAPAGAEGVMQTPSQKKPLLPVQEAKELSAAAIARSVKDGNFAAFIDTAEQTVGRVFNLHELNILTSLLDTTPFSQEYLLTLISYCKTKTKRFSFGYLEKTAYSMLERECLTVEDLNEYLAQVERVSSEEWKLRRLFGFGERRLSPKERAYFERWVGQYGYTVEIIGIAYDIAVNNTGKVALAYMDKLIARFHENGCTDVAAVEALLEKERAEQAAKPPSQHTGGGKTARDTTFQTGLTDAGSATDGSSFVAADFLSAALRRSYGDDGEDKS